MNLQVKLNYNLKGGISLCAQGNYHAGTSFGQLDPVQDNCNSEIY